MPGGALGSTFGAREPCASKHVKALTDRGKKAKVVPLRFDFPQEGSTLGGAQHVQEGVLWQVKPTDRTAPVIVHRAERGPSPFKLLQGLDKSPNGPSPTQGLDMMLDLLGQPIQRSIPVNLAPETEQGFALRDSVDFEGMAWNTYGHESPEFDPLVAFGADGGFESMVVGRLYRA